MKTVSWYSIFFFVSITNLNAQVTFQQEKRDHIWILGQGTDGTRINFNHHPPLITYEISNLTFQSANASICTSHGDLLFYTNGIAIQNYLNEVVINGDGLNPDPATASWADSGYPLPQGVLILPYPNTPDLFIVFHSTLSVNVFPINGTYLFPMNCYYTIVDMAPGEVGQVLEKNALILSDTLDFGKLTAVRHANGRDWWITQQEYFANRQYAILLKPSGVTVQPSQTMGPNRPTGFGQAVFSPDGKKYAILSAHLINDDPILDIYNFDRCSGTWSNPLQIIYEEPIINGCGIAISPNSRFLYVSSYFHVYQYDLQAADITASREIIAVYDGFGSPNPQNATSFCLAQLAPDNKIYISTRAVSDRLHIIHNPNAKGTACQIEQHGIPLPAINNIGLPNSPYYGLGPEDGSPCDTLGIDHHPQADFRYMTETSVVNFYDYSRFFPTEWFWTFGDGSSSTERDPVHNYAENGVYEVCLIVRNANASDTLCQEVEVIVTGIDEAVVEKALLKVFPNPASDYVVLQVAGAEALALAKQVKPEWVLYDALGREVRRVILQHPEAQTVASLGNVAPGMYFWHLTAGGMTMQTGKLSVVK